MFTTYLLKELNAKLGVSLSLQCAQIQVDSENFST